ncbi:MAG: cytochrome c oxidase subunit 3 [Vicingus serpentipes]|nr:cytochrome c oxidase subunit 3 [Vicingus serpentipes]
MTTLTVENMNFQSDVKNKTAKPLLWIGLMSIVMFFAGLTSAVVVSKASNTWIQFHLPFMFTVSTILIIVSSTTFQWGVFSIKSDKLITAKLAFGITLLFGVAFVISQFYAWRELYESGIIAAGSGSTPAGSYFYAITALHLLHVLGGLISLIVVLIKSIREKYSSNNYLGVQISVTYWHFLGALWIYLFFFLRFIA